MTFGAHMIILYIIKVKILVLIERSYTPPPQKKKTQKNDVDYRT